MWFSRDLKPANILIHEATLEPWIVDFGVAKPLTSGQGGTRVGTPGFIAPEIKEKIFTFSKGSEKSDESLGEKQNCLI